MGRVRHPNLQNVNGKYFEGATVTAVTNRDTEVPADAYTTEEGATTVTYPVTAGSEGEVNIWVGTGAYETTFGEDTVDTPAVWDAVSGEDVANMLTVGDIVGFPDYVFSPLDFGGDPTGIADSTTAIQDAIDAAAAVDGTVHLGNGDAIWKYSSQLTMAIGTRITSAGGAGRSGVGNATLRYTGTGSTPAFLCDSVQRFEIDHVEFDYSNTAFTGPLVRLDGGGGDIINANIHHCGFRAINGIATLSADCLLLLHKTIISEISECAFNGAANNLLQLGQPTAGSSYINQVSINNCSFNDTANHDRGQIAILSNDVEALDIANCSFEGASPNNIVPIRGGNTGDGDNHDNVIYSMTVRQCWSGDAGGAGPDNGFAIGLNGLGNFAPVIFEGNFIGPSGGTAVTCGDNGCAFLFIGNHVTQGYLAGTGGAGGSLKFWSAYNRVPGGLFDPADPPVEYTAFAQDFSHLAGRFSLETDTDFEDVAGTWLANDQIVIGGNVQAATGLLNIGDRIAMYSRFTSGTNRCLTLQADQTDDAGEVQLVAGTTPAMKIRASGVGVAFNGTAPIAKPDITGSRGGNAALADLLTSLASLGLITDSSSA